MANSFSQQLKSRSAQQQQSRLSRTQRQISAQDQQKQQRYEQLRQQAQAVSDNVFSKNLTFEQYKSEYSKLSPELQQFFSNPQEIISTEKAKVTDKLTSWGKSIEEQKQKMKDAYDFYVERSQKDPKDKKRYHKNYEEKVKKYNEKIDEYQDRIRELQNKSPEIEKGYQAGELIEYAYSKADYQKTRIQEQTKSKEQFQRDLASGKLDQTIEQLNKFRGIGKTGLSYAEYSKAIQSYNKEVEVRQGLQKYAERLGGFEKLPDWAKQRLSPDAMKFQAENPSEVLSFDTSGNVKGVTSKALGMSVVGTDAYSEKVKEQQERDERLRNEAKIQLASLSGMEISEKPENKTFWQKFVTGVKAISLSSQFGVSTQLPETTVASLSQERQQRTRDIFKIDDVGDIIKLSRGVPILEIGTVPYESSLKAIERQEASDYRAKQKAEAISELDKLIGFSSEELKPYIQDEGIKILQEKGIGFKEITTPKLDIDLGKIGGETKFPSLKQEKTETTITLSDPDFQRRISQNTFDFEKEMKQKDYVGASFVGLRFATSEALKVYVVGKAFKYATKGIGIVGSKIFSRSLVGFSMEGLKTVGGVNKLQLGLPEITRGQKLLYNVGKIGIYGGAIGLTGYQKYKQLKYYQGVSDYGNLLFGIETFGQSVGVGLLIRDELVYKKDIERLNKQIEKENELLLKKKQSIQNIKEYGQFSKKATTSYEQAGIGKEVKLNDQQLRVVAKDYARVTGVSEDKAFSIIKEKSIYRTTLSVRDSQVPSIERQLKFQRTGIADAGDDVYRISRYGFTDQVQTPQGVKEYAFEFNVKGNKISRLQLKTTLTTDEYALTNVFEKARYSYKTPEQVLRLKDTILTKASKISTAKVGNVKITLSDTENRLLLKNAYGSERFSLKEAFKIGLSDGQLDDIARTWERTGLDARKVSQFKSLRFETPLYRGGEIKIATGGEYQFLQVGAGKRDLVLKDIVYNLKKSGFFNEIASLTKKTSTPIYSQNLINTEVSNALKVSSFKDLGIPQTEIVKGTLKNIQISPTISSFDVSTKVQLKETIKSMSNLGISLLGGLSTQTLSGQGVKSYSRSKQDLQQKSLNINAEILRQDLALKQITQQSMKTQQASALTYPKQFPMFATPTVTAPTYTTPSYNFGYPKMALFGNQGLKKKIKAKRKVSPETFGLFPDFTSRAIGLSPQEFNLKDVNKAVRKLQTGFEVRRGGRIKGITEKNLMKEVVLKL